MPRSFIAAILTLVGALALGPILVQPAAAGDMAPLVCANAGVLDRVIDNLRYEVSHVPNLPDVDIVGFKHVRETSYPGVMNSWAGSGVARQYCHATAIMSDGNRRDVWYLVEFGMGFASIGDKVFSCVAGLDPWHVNDGYCRVLR
jgi:hypothetical protein